MENVKTSKLDFLKAKLEVANAQNARLAQENALLREKLETLTAEDRAHSTLHIEAKLKAFQLEEERDRMYEKLEKIKRKYNQLHEAYIQKVKRCRALEEVFSRQKTLNGLVMKSALEQREKEQQASLQKHRPKHVNVDNQSVASLEAEARAAKLQAALDEAYDMIDELEFELESLDFLEVENQRLRNELETYKKEKLQLRRASSIYPEESAQAARNATDAAVARCDELPAYRPADNNSSPRYNLDSNASSLADSYVGDLDATTMERLVLTESLIQTAESESNCLRRELLRSRLRNASRPSVRPTSSDA